jgi:ubiquitin-activating enzyme E1
LVNFFDNREGFLEELKKQNRQNPTTLRGKLESIKKLYDAYSLKSYEICLELSVAIFQDVFNHQIKHLLHAFPADYISDETKKPFWSGYKRVPSPIELNLKDPIHVEFIQAGANIYATMFGLANEKDKGKVIEIAKRVKLIEFVPRGGVVIETE